MSVYSITWDIFETIFVIGLISISPIIFTWYSLTSDTTDPNYNSNRKNAIIAGVILFLLTFLSMCSSIWHYNDSNRAVVTDAFRNAGGSYKGTLQNLSSQAYNNAGQYFKPYSGSSPPYSGQI
jgi:hypothetical protein